MTEEQPRAEAGDIHRLLDDLFDGVERTPQIQDLKEEVRANLMERVTELVDHGETAPGEAAHRAMAELGDIGELLDAPPAPGAPTPRGGEEARREHRVRPSRTYVLGVSIAALVAASGLLLATMGATGMIPLPAGPLVAFTGLTATGVAWMTGLSLSRETTTRHPAPQHRAAGYFLAVLLGVFGLGLLGLVSAAALPLWTMAFAVFGVVAGIACFAFLLATRTNRRKAWVRALQRERRARTGRFEKEPETAVRFGIYTMVIWVVSFALFVVLGTTAGWGWSWLALVVGFAAMMTTFARMQYRTAGAQSAPGWEEDEPRAPGRHP